MREITFYRWILALPVLACALAWIFTYAGAAELPSLPVLVIAGAIPYLLTTAGLVIASTRISERKFFSWCHWAPFISAFWFVVQVCVVFGYQAATAENDWVGGLAAMGAIGSVFCLVIGYAFVAIAKLLHYVLKALKLIAVAPPEGQGRPA